MTESRRGSDAIGIAALSLLAAGARFRLLAEHPEATGTDGYYYVVQVQDAVSSGALHVPDGSWVLWWLAGAHLVSADPVLAVKLGAAALLAVCVPAAWWAGRALGGPAAAWACAAWVVASPTLTHLAADFPKNLGALPAWWVFVGALSGAGGRARWPLAGVAAVCAATGHRSGAALVGLTTLGWLVGTAVGRRRVSSRALIAGAATLAAFAAASLLLPNILHPADLERLTGQLRLQPWPPLPVAWAALRPTSPLELAEWCLLWPALVAGAATCLRAEERRSAALMLLVPGLVLANPWWASHSLDLGYRLTLLGPAVAVMLLATTVPSSLTLARDQAKRVLFAAMLAAPWLGWQGWSPDQDPPYARWRVLIEAVPRPLPRLTIAHQGLSFLFDHLTGSEALPWAPEPHLDRDHIGRIAWGIRDAEWSAHGADGVVRLDVDYAWLPESSWEAFVASARRGGEPDLLARIDDERNPSRVRPRSLLRNRSQDGGASP